MSNAVLSFFKDAGQELLSHPNSLMRGLSNSAGMTGAFYAMEQAGQLSNGSLSLYLLGGVTGAVTYMLHRPKEEKNDLLKEAYPEKKFKNFFNKASEYALTAVTFAAGIAGIGAGAIAVLPHETTQAIGLNENHAQLGIMASVMMPALSIVGGFLRNRLSLDDDKQVKTAKNLLQAKL